MRHGSLNSLFQVALYLPSYHCQVPWLDDPLLKRPFSALQVTYQDLVAICKRRGILIHNRRAGLSKEGLLEILAPLFKTPKVFPHTPACTLSLCPPELNLRTCEATQEVASALRVAWGTGRPRSYGGKWGGFTGDYEVLELEELQEEALCEGVPLGCHDLRFRPCPVSPLIRRASA